VLEDVLIVAASVIKRQLAQKQVHLPVITAVSRAMSPVIARWKPRPNLATSVARKDTFLVTAPRQALRQAQEEVAGLVEEVAAAAPNVTAVEKQGISRVHAPRPEIAAVEDTVVVVVVVAAVGTVEGTVAVEGSVAERLAIVAVA